MFIQVVENQMGAKPTVLLNAACLVVLAAVVMGARAERARRSGDCRGRPLGGVGGDITADAQPDFVIVGPATAHAKWA